METGKMGMTFRYVQVVVEYIYECVYTVGVETLLSSSGCSQ